MSVDVLSAASMDPTAAQGRFGVDYLQLITSQAGYGCSEPRPGEDVRAIDATIAFPYGDAHVQVKSTTKDFTKKLATITIPVEEGWLESWAKLSVRGPVYLVVVKVPDRVRWIEHPDDHTRVGATAYWARIDPAGKPKSLKVQRSQRLTADTLNDWALERQQALTGKGA